MALPFLPGNNYNKNLGKTKFHKSHHFDYNNEVASLDETKCGIGGEPLMGQKLKPKNSKFPAGEGSDLPSWVAFDRQVLCFDAYFQEAVHERREEQYRIRNCKVYFYLEDDSIQVIEPRNKNSGVPQGTLIRRHRIPLPAPNDDKFYNVDHFNVGKEINFYSRSFKLTGCDEFTHNFLRKLGVRVSLPEGAPGDPYSKHRKALDESMQPLRPYEKHDTLKQFLDHDRQVLRFYCYWDDRDSMFGDVRETVLHYFLADDTIEIREVIHANSGRDAAPMFLRRERLPKNIRPLTQPGTNTDRTVLNVFGPMGHGGRYILDNLKTGAVEVEYYKDSDLVVGRVINAWGRKFILSDCDDFTKEYYQVKYGINDFNPVQYKKEEGFTVKRNPPPYNGFGSEEDSLCSTMGLLPKPPRRDFIKFMEKDRHGLESNVLRFLCKFDTDKPIDKDRRFIASYFLSDDTILVFEPIVRNSGIIGGKFLERGRVKKPDQPRYSTTPSEYYTAQDLYVGAKVIFNSYKFELIDADEYAFRYMERFSDEFPMANIALITKSLQAKSANIKDEVRSYFERNDPNGVGSIQYEQFVSLMTQLVPTLSTHEIMTIARYYSDRKEDKGMDADSLTAIIQEQLRKNNFETFQNLLENFIHQDKDRSGFLDVSAIRTACRAMHVPVADDLLRALISHLQNEDGKTDYNQLLQRLNWRDYPAGQIRVPNSDNDPDWVGTKAKDMVERICYQALLEDVLGKQS